MNNIINYVQQEMRTFDEKSFCRVDSLVLSQLAYIQMDSVFRLYDGNQEQDKGLFADLEEVISLFFSNTKKNKFLRLNTYDLLKQEYFDEMFGEVFSPESTQELLFAVAASPRFRDIKLAFYANEYDPEIEKQFAAVTFLLDKDSSYVAFRGTDSTLTGWKEDFNMAYAYPVPAQAAASKYLNMAAKFLPKKIYVGGHSKGGNLAIYSVMKCDRKVRKRVEYCFSHDGPGFREELIQSGEFADIASKVYKTVPEDSIIGMLMKNHDNYEVVKSNEHLINQHDAFTWEIEDFDFVEIDDISKIAKYTKLSVSQWLEKMPSDKGQVFIDELFNLLAASNSTTFKEMEQNWKTALPAIYKAIGNMDDDTKAVMKEAMNDLASVFWKNL